MKQRKTEKSKKLFEIAGRLLVGGVNSPVRAFKAVGDAGVASIFADRGRGCRLRDEDGNTYIDFCMSWGPLMLGHAPESVQRAVRAALRGGTSFGMCHRSEAQLAQRVQNAFPSMELMRFVSSGTEACMSALRAARGFTGRDKILKFDGCYHGHSDGLLVKAGSGALSFGAPDSAGVPAGYAAETLVAPYNDIAAVEDIFKKRGGEIAAVIVEPVAANAGVILPKQGFLECLRKLCDSSGAILVFDEVITGFRLGMGGAQARFGVRPDMTCLGKIIGGGFPVGCYGGRRGIMEKVAPLGPVYQAGTLSGNPIAMAAGIAVLDKLRGSDSYKSLENAASEFCGRIESAARKHGVKICVNKCASMFTVFFTEGPVADLAGAKKSDAAAYGRFFRALLDEGVYFPPSQFEACFLSTEHSQRELDHAIRGIRRSFGKISAGR